MGQKFNTNKKSISPPESQNRFVFLISMASFMGTLDSTIVNISLPTIAILVMARYAGMISDRMGSRTPCIAGIFCYMVAFILFSFFDATTPVYQ